MDLIRIRQFGHPFLHPVQMLGIPADRSIDIAHGDVGKSIGQEELCDSNSGGTCTVYDNAAGFL